MLYYTLPYLQNDQVSLCTRNQNLVTRCPIYVAQIDDFSSLPRVQRRSRKRQMFFFAELTQDEHDCPSNRQKQGRNGEKVFPASRVYNKPFDDHTKYHHYDGKTKCDPTRNQHSRAIRLSISAIDCIPWRRRKFWRH